MTSQHGPAHSEISASERELLSLRHEVNPRGWGILHDVYFGRWYAVRGSAEWAVAATAAEMGARLAAVEQDTATMPAVE